jgi:hypothetical protein
MEIETMITTAPVTLRHQCGHAATVRLTGTLAARERMAIFAAGRPCRGCEVRPPAALADQEEDDQWPALTGSPRQVDWAMTIRSTKAGIIALMLDGVPGGIKILAALRHKSAARWWIDRRGQDAQDIADEIDRELAATTPTTDHDADGVINDR